MKSTVPAASLLMTRMQPTALKLITEMPEGPEACASRFQDGGVRVPEPSCVRAEMVLMSVAGRRPLPQPGPLVDKKRAETIGSRNANERLGPNITPQALKTFARQARKGMRARAAVT